LKLRIHLFEWPSRHNVHLALPIMLVLSFLLHAGSLFLFHATFPRSGGSPEQSAAVNYILPDSPEAAKLAPMLAASDPALFSSQVFGPNVWNLPKTTYVASFDQEATALKPLPAPPPSQFLPPYAGTSPVTVAAVVPKPPQLREPALPTILRFSGALEERAWTPPADPQFSETIALTRQGLAPAEFLVAVSPEGLPLHFFPQQSSGDEDLDRAALRYLAGCRFTPSPREAGTTWGTATFVWGGDIRQRSQP
jgi:outer membrane biosynthesis protein TonB